jgi:hypothetical protein
MAVYTPPTETLPIFDSGVFPASLTGSLTPSTGTSYFLSYPVAQGQETITDLITTNITNTNLTTTDINAPLPTTSTLSIMELGTYSSGTNLNSIINIGQSKTSGSGVNNSTINIGDYSAGNASNLSGSAPTINIGSQNLTNNNQTYTNIQGRLRFKFTNPNNIQKQNLIYGGSYLFVGTITNNVMSITSETYNSQLFATIGPLGNNTAYTLFLMPVTENQVIYVRNISGIQQTISSSDSSLIILGSGSGAYTSTVLIASRTCMQFYCDGTYWYVISLT